MGKKKNREMMFWTKEQYLKFAEVMMDKPQSFYAFEMLYWCGIREGELLALTPADFDFEKGTVSVSYTHLDMVTEDGTIYHVQSFFVGDLAMCDLLDALTIEAIERVK